MRKKFWDYIENPSEKKKAKLTSEEQRFAKRLSEKTDGKSQPPQTPAPKKNK